MIQKCDVYIFDEPTSYLDVKQRIEMAGLVRGMQTLENYIIVVEHDLSILDYLSDYICVLYGEPAAYGVVTMPFLFEGSNRMKVAEEGVRKLQQNVDTLIIIQNQNLFRIASENTSLREAFQLADEVLNQGVSGITHLITSPGLINLDFADIRTIMSDMGRAMMGTGEAGGEERAIKAAEAAVANPLLHHSSLEGAGAVIINITGGKDMTLFEVTEAAGFIREKVGNPSANIIFGSTFDPDLDGSIKISVVATGMEGDDDDFEAREERADANQEEQSQQDEDSKVDDLDSEDEQYSEGIEGVVASEEEILDDETLQQMQPKYDEYQDFADNDAARELELSQTANIVSEEEFYQEEQPQAELVTEGAPAQARPAPQKSFFSRMLSSIISSEPKDRYSNIQPAAPKNSATDIRNKPSFLKKDN